MKIRSITLGMEINPPILEKTLEQIGTTAQLAKQWFESKGYQVQTLRFSTQPWEEYAKNKKELIHIIKRLQHLTISNHIDYFNIGPTHNPNLTCLLYDVIRSTSTGFCTTHITKENTIDEEQINETCQLIQRLSTLEANGFANLRFAALCNISAHTPFYPASFHRGSPSLGIALENSDLVNKAFQNATSIKQAKTALKNVLSTQYQKIDTLAKQLCEDLNLTYAGLDTSISSSVKKKESIAFAIEQIISHHFGSSGTLSIAKLITSVLEELPVQKTGYNGLMLPVLEDYGLAKRNNEHRFNLSTLLSYSAVCGTGLDTIPLPGSVSADQLQSILFDVASLSTKLHKPLSARLLPIPHRRIGEQTQFDFEYFVNTSIMSP